MKFLDEIKKLNLPKNKFVIFGSGPLVIRDLRKNKDIDIIVKEDLWKELIKKYKVKDNKLIEIGNMEIFKDWKPWFNDANKLIDDADIIEGFRFVKLKYVLKWKKEFNREKDRRDVKLIENYLKCQN